MRRGPPRSGRAIESLQKTTQSQIYREEGTEVAMSGAAGFDRVLEPAALGSGFAESERDDEAAGQRMSRSALRLTSILARRKTWTVSRLEEPGSSSARPCFAICRVWSWR